MNSHHRGPSVTVSDSRTDSHNIRDDVLALGLKSPPVSADPAEAHLDLVRDTYPSSSANVPVGQDRTH